MCFGGVITYNSPAVTDAYAIGVILGKTTLVCESYVLPGKFRELVSSFYLNPGRAMVCVYPVECSSQMGESFVIDGKLMTYEGF